MYTYEIYKQYHLHEQSFMNSCCAKISMPVTAETETVTENDGSV